MKWISVDKKVPEKDQVVLVVCRAQYYTNEREIYLCVYEDHQYKIRPFYYFDEENSYVAATHWMPVPKMPEIK